MNLGLQINKKDAITIVLLSIVFFSIAVVNLGLTQSPTTTAQLTAGQSFYLDLGNQTNVKSMVFLLKQGAINVTISAGSPGNWTVAVTENWPYSNSQWSEDYYKYVQYNGQSEVPINQVTQYLKLDIGPTGSYNTIIAEIAVIDQNNQQVKIQSITNTATETQTCITLSMSKTWFSTPQITCRTRILTKYTLSEQQSSTCIHNCLTSGHTRRLAN